MDKFNEVYTKIIMEEDLTDTMESDGDQTISETFFAAAAEVNGKLKFLVTSNARWRMAYRWRWWI